MGRGPPPSDDPRAPHEAQLAPEAVVDALDAHHQGLRGEDHLLDDLALHLRARLLLVPEAARDVPQDVARPLRKVPDPLAHEVGLLQPLYRTELAEQVGERGLGEVVAVELVAHIDYAALLARGIKDAGVLDQTRV